MSKTHIVGGTPITREMQEHANRVAEIKIEIAKAQSELEEAMSALAGCDADHYRTLLEYKRDLASRREAATAAKGAVTLWRMRLGRELGKQ